MSWDGPLTDTGNGMHEIPSSYKGKAGNLKMNVPARIVAQGELLQHITDDLAPEQLANVATLPGIVGHALAMPDIHWGYGFPIGGVAAFGEDGVVSPGGVGFDINCGVRLLTTDLRADQINMEQLADTLFARVPCGMGKRGNSGVESADILEVMAKGGDWAVEHGYASTQDQACMEEGGVIPADVDFVSDRAKLRGLRSLGSLGSGNHFLEIQEVTDTFDESFGMEAGQVVIMIHTGSRGLGHQICQDHVGDLQGLVPVVDRQLACAPIGSKQADTYLGAMGAAANFAFVNRSIITSITRSVLDDFGGKADVLWDVCHNIAKWETHQIPGTDERQRVLVHRKGATRAFGPGSTDLPEHYQQSGQPVLVPGDMGRASFVLAAQEGAMENTFGSCCHGAGRRLSRSAAKQQFDGQDLIDRLAKQGILVRAASAQVAAEEAPEAYKDVSQVVASVEGAGLAKRAARMRPLAVIKG